MLPTDRRTACSSSSDSSPDVVATDLMAMLIAAARALLACTMLLLLSGCGYDTLYSELDEQQANDMLALLLREGFDARKTRLDEAWTLEVARDHLPRAVDILKTHGYPRDGYESLGDIFKKEGFVSSPLEERARLVHGLSQELSRTVSNIDGVIMARVHLALPEPDPLREERPPSSASIFIKHRPGASLTQHTASIKALVVNSVEGLPYDNVTVSFFEADPVPVAAPPPASGYPWDVPTVWVESALGIVTVACIAMGLALRRRTRTPVVAAE